MNLPYFEGLAPATFFIGGTGAGKTELSLNLAIWKSKRFKEVTLIDFDIVNPFFRVRKLKDTIEEAGIKIVMPEARTASSDIPALPGAVFGSIENASVSVVCDVGGGEPGLRPLGMIKELAEQRKANVFFVVNPFRPGFSNSEELKESFEHMSALSGMKVSHLVVNPNLSGDTTKELFDEGVDLVRKFSEKSGVPIAFVVAEKKLAAELCKMNAMDITEAEFFSFDNTKLFAIKRYWDIPWKFG